MIRRAAIMLLAAAGIAIVAVWAAWQALGGNRVRVAQANEWAWPGTSYVAFVLSGEPQAFFENYARRYGSCPYLGGAGFDGGHFSRCPPDTTFNEARAIRFDREGDDRCFIYNHIDVPLPEVTEKPRLFIFAVPAGTYVSLVDGIPGRAEDRPNVGPTFEVHRGEHIFLGKFVVDRAGLSQAASNNLTMAPTGFKIVSPRQAPLGRVGFMCAP
jgi:hypothetical protein